MAVTVAPRVRQGLVLTALALGLGLAGCGSSDKSQPPAPSSTSQPSMPQASGSATPEAVVTAVPSSSVDVGADPSTSASPTVEAPKATLKQAAAAKLPDKLDGLSGHVAQSGPGTTIGQYTGETPDQMLVVTLHVGQQKAAALAELAEARTAEHATCGKLAKTGLAGCYLWLEGGNIQLYGTDKTRVEDLRQYAESLYAKLA